MLLSSKAIGLTKSSPQESPALSHSLEEGIQAYSNGDYAIALEHFKPFAEQGYADAQFNLGVMYNNGEGVLQNASTAVDWYTKSAEQGYARAQFILGLMYNTGKEISENASTAVEWCREAAFSV